MHQIDQRRVRSLSTHSASSGPVLYWMIRELRAHDNWALLHAQNLALASKSPLLVIVALRPNLEPYSGTARLLDAMLSGLEETVRTLQQSNIQFQLEVGDPVASVLKVAKQHAVGTIVTDFYPLNMYREWQEHVAKAAACTVQVVDGHNIVPCWHASPKQEYAARTFRPKIHRQLDEFLTEFPQLFTHPFGSNSSLPNWQAIRQQITVDERVKLPDWYAPGTAAGHGQLGAFIRHHLDDYAATRNDPNAQTLSNLSSWLHFGFISPQRVALAVSQASAQPENKQAYLEELIVRRELSDNFCWYNPKYDSPKGYPNWAKKTLSEHADDPREYLYSLEQLDVGDTHDPLWNAAQHQMVQSGKMHGWLRMYWAKKILEWTPSVETAHSQALYLNDRYELDGRDPNGYVGIAWSMGGVHDRAWPERPIFGKIRYMNFNGAKRKFDVAKFIKRWSPHATALESRG